MKIRTSLRYRVTLAFALLGMVVSLGLAGAFYKLTIDMEERLITETLSAELDDYISRYNVDANAPPPTSTTIQTYVIQFGDKSAPDVLRSLKPGLHKVQIEGRQHYAEVKENGEHLFIVLYDDKQVRHRVNQFKLFFAIGVAVMVLLSAVLGLWLARRVISPVGELALRVSGLQPENYHTPLVKEFHDDEVGTLAHEFDAYLQRMAALIERERSFTADVSHELRTPLAVIKGATEVLLSEPDLDDTLQPRLKRIARSVGEMSEIVSALLHLAREHDEVSEPGCSVAEVLQHVVAAHQHLLQHKPVEIKLTIQEHTILPVKCSLLHVVLANLVRNAIYYTEQGHVYVDLDNKGISVKDTGIGIPKDQIKRIFDRYYIGSTGGEGIGLSLVKRICQRYGWRIDIESTEGRGSIFRLSF